MVLFTANLYTRVVRHARVRTPALGQAAHNATIGQSELLCSRLAVKGFLAYLDST